MDYDANIKILVGGIYSSSRCGEFEVIERSHVNRVKIKFLNTGFETVVQSSHIRAGAVNDYFMPVVHGRGFLGNGDFSTKDKKIYLAWKNMFERCYSKIYHERFPTYVDCEVSEEWYNFQSFAQWYKDTHPWDVQLPMGRWELDKDLKTPRNKTYSPDNCTWLPSHLNINIRLSDPNKDWKYMTGVSYDIARPNTFKTTFNSMRKPEGKFTKSFKSEIEAHRYYIEMKNIYIQELVEFYKDYLSFETVNLLKDLRLTCPCCESS